MKFAGWTTLLLSFWRGLSGFEWPEGWMVAPVEMGSKAAVLDYLETGERCRSGKTKRSCAGGVFFFSTQHIYWQNWLRAGEFHGEAHVVSQRAV